MVTSTGVYPCLGMFGILLENPQTVARCLQIAFLRSWLSYLRRQGNPSEGCNIPQSQKNPRRSVNAKWDPIQTGFRSGGVLHVIGGRDYLLNAFDNWLSSHTFQERGTHAWAQLCRVFMPFLQLSTYNSSLFFSILCLILCSYMGMAQNYWYSK